MKANPPTKFLSCFLSIFSYATQADASISRYAAIDLQATYGSDLTFRGMSKNGTLTGYAPNPALVKVQNGIRTETAREANWGYVPYNDQGISYRYQNIPGSTLTALNPDGTVTDTGYHLQGNSMSLNGHNRLGTVVGAEGGLTTNIFASGGFIYDPVNGGRLVETIDDVSVIAFERINDAGYIVGHGLTDGGNGSGTYLWREGRPALQLVNDASLGDSEARGINEAGQVIGLVGRDAFFWNGTSLLRPARYSVQDPTHPGTFNQVITSASCRGLSEDGMVVGAAGVRTVPGFTKPTSGVKGWIWTAEDGLVWMDDLIDPALGFQLTGAIDLADDGSILATGFLNGSNVPHQFLLTPVPEPSVLLLSILGVGLAIRRRRSDGDGLS